MIEYEVENIWDQKLELIKKFDLNTQKVWWIDEWMGGWVDGWSESRFKDCILQSKMILAYK